MAKAIMLQGTMSHVGKTALAAGLCRLLRRRGRKVAPFKVQNLSDRFYRLPDGRLLGVGQAVQAYAAGIAPDVRMNPVCLSYNGGRVEATLDGNPLSPAEAGRYRSDPDRLFTEVLHRFYSLASEYDWLVIEGAGCPAELNLAGRDIANMRFARAVGAPVILVGDAERGGVFASLYGTLRLLGPEDRARVAGLLINKLDGDPRGLDPGPALLAERLAKEEGRPVPVLGVIPRLALCLPEEDTADGPSDAGPSAWDDGLDRLADALDSAVGVQAFEALAGDVRPPAW